MLAEANGALGLSDAPAPSRHAFSALSELDPVAVRVFDNDESHTGHELDRTERHRNSRVAAAAITSSRSSTNTVNLFGGSLAGECWNSFLARGAAGGLGIDRRGELPTLVIAGGKDLVCPPHLGKAVADSIPGAQFEVWPEAAHQPFQEDPDTFNTRLETFWASIAR